MNLAIFSAFSQLAALLYSRTIYTEMKVAFTQHRDGHVGLFLVLPRCEHKARVVSLLCQLYALDAQLPCELSRLLNAEIQICQA